MEAGQIITNSTLDLQNQLLIMSRDIKALQDGLDAFYQLMCGTFISLVQPGFALFEAGAIHSKNASNIILKNLLDTFVSACSYYLVGYALAYGDGNHFMGLTYWAGTGLPPQKLPHWYYQFIFANTAATIISGAVAERCNFVAYLTYSITITAFVYPVASCWVWNDKGWLKQMGFIDFSGSGVVHALGGSCSLIGAYLIGPRIGRFVNGKAQDIRGHSAPLLGIGMLLIVTGFLAFNGGSLPELSQPGDNIIMATAMVNTAVSASGAVLTALILGRLGAFGKYPWPYFEIINSTLCGLVAVCAGCDQFELWAALVTGGIATIIFWILKYTVIAMKIDDPVDAIATHFGSGFWGILARPILGRGGVVYDIKSRTAWKAFGINLFGVVMLVSWGLVSSLVIFGLLSLFGKLRISEEEERMGNDVKKHGGYAYPLSAYDWDFQKTSMDNRISLAINTLSNGSKKDSTFQSPQFEMPERYTVVPPAKLD